MSGKSRHDKGSHHHQSKKSKTKQRSLAPVVQPQVVARTPEPAVPARVSATSVKVTAPSAAPKTKIVSYPYITGELRRIGILGGILLGILIILALVLS